MSDPPGSHNLRQKFECALSRIHGIVAVAAELDIDGSGIVNVVQSIEDIREVHLAFAELEMLVGRFFISSM